MQHYNALNIDVCCSQILGGNSYENNSSTKKHHPNQRPIVNWALKNKLQWILKENATLLIQQNTFRNVVFKMLSILSRRQCVPTYRLQVTMALWVGMHWYTDQHGGHTELTEGKRVIPRETARAGLLSCSVCLNGAGLPHSHSNDVIMGATASQITDVSIVCLTIYWRRWKKTSKLPVTGLCEGNPLTGGFPQQRANKRGKCFRFMTSSCFAEIPSFKINSEIVCSAWVG